MTRITSTDYRRPHRPGPVKLANAVFARFASRLSLTPESLIDEARRQTGLHDLGPNDFREPLAKLVDSIEREARLTPVGRFITKTRLVSTLANRLRLEDYTRCEPGVAAERIARPIVIIGLQRTGTTLLHRLLASDPKLRALASWEALNPVPFGALGLGRDPRIGAAETSERALAYLAPDFFAVHPVEASAPEEDVLLLDLSLRSTVPEATLRVPSFSRWLEVQDQRPAYRIFARALGALQHQRRATRWVLKTPHHLEWLDALLEELPDALFVWTHRDPLTTVPSFCSMVAHGRGVFSDAVDPWEIGRDWSRKVARMIERAMATRARVGEDRFVDVQYADLVRDPLAQVGVIYARAGMGSVSPHAKDLMSRLLSVQVQHRHGEHRYAPGDFGLTHESLERAFEAYRARFVSGP